MFNALYQISPKCGPSSPEGPLRPYGRVGYAADLSTRQACPRVGPQQPVRCEQADGYLFEEGEDTDKLCPFEIQGLENLTRCQKASLGQKYGNSHRMKTYFNYSKLYSAIWLQF